MAYYKDGRFLQQQQGPDFDAIHRAGHLTPSSGIYRCEYCGLSVTSVQGHPLPSQNHHQHGVPSPISWRLIVKSHFN
jgi:hypothetical protein